MYFLSNRWLSKCVLDLYVNVTRILLFSNGLYMQYRESDRLSFGTTSASYLVMSGT